MAPAGPCSARPNLDPSRDQGQLQGPVLGLEPSATMGWRGCLGARLTLTPSEPACRACAPLPALCPLPELRAEATLPVLPRLLRSPPAQREEMPSGLRAPWPGQRMSPCCGQALLEPQPPRPSVCPSPGTGRVPAACTRCTCEGFPQHPDLLRGSRRGRSALRRREVRWAHVSPAGPLVAEQRAASGVRGSVGAGSQQCGTGRGDPWSCNPSLPHAGKSP